MPLHYQVRGEGKPLVLIHGLFGSLENLGAIARILAEDYRVFSVDLPNHGRSLHTHDTSLESMAALLRQWLDEHGLETPHLLGHSLGGKVAMELSLRHPERVEDLVVVDIAPVNYGAHHNQIFKALQSVDLNQLQQRSHAEALLATQIEEAAVRSFLLKNLTRKGDTFAWRMNLPVLHASYPKLLKANVDTSFCGATLFVKGGESAYIQAHYKEEIARRFPNASLKIVANAGHWVHAEKPTLVSSLVKRFLARDNA